ncbi:vascular endothelial growth factor A-like isoform X2 [Dendropsophus ebraccatus]|uniref:vascular endothelial growth factor A-like isoform X2 n=1 Tax=Dendropsophus ebraccatus TaxID=150705 RepID=UPI0038311108
MDCMIGSSLVWLSILVHCILTPLSVSQTSQTQRLEGQAWMDIFNRSKCQPRWVLLNLLNELPQFSDFLFKPPCVSVLRCAGCCLDEAQSCFPLQSNIIRMQVQVHKTYSDPEYTEISVLQHTECECRLTSTSGDKKAKKRRRKGKKGKGASKNARSICPPCGRRRTLNPKNCKCVCDLSEAKCNWRGLILNTERCRCEKPRS